MKYFSVNHCTEIIVPFSWNDLLYAWSKITSPLSRWCLIKYLYIVTNDHLGKHYLSLCSSPMDVLTLSARYLKCSQEFNFSSKNKPRCFWYGICITWLLLKINTGWIDFLTLREKITSCLEGLGLKLGFHWYLQLLIFSRSLFKALIEKCHLQKAYDLMIIHLINH